MRIELLENQIEIILKSLENYTKINPDKIQLIYSTYESLQYQQVSQCNQNVTQMLHKSYLQNRK